MTHPESGDGASVGRVLADMGRDLGILFRQEIDLARCELAEKALDAKSGAMKCGIGVGMGIASVLVLASALVIGLTYLLSQWMPALAAALISSLVVGIALGVGAYALLKDGSRSMSPSRFIPERTIESLKENSRWAKEQI